MGVQTNQEGNFRVSGSIETLLSETLGILAGYNHYLGLYPGGNVKAKSRT